MSKLKYYIYFIRKTTMSQAARELNLSYVYFVNIVNEKMHAGKKTAIKISKWCDNYVTTDELMDMPAIAQ